jgi:hypothetical protein
MNWKQIPKFPNYEASDEGHIRHVGATEPKKQKEKGGYFDVSLYVGKSKKVQQRAHRLVAMAWIPNPENKPEINHLDGDKKNNNINNLEWCTRKENQAHAKRNGLLKSAFERFPCKGQDHPRSKLSEKDARAIWALKGTMTVRQIANKFGVSKKTVESILYKWRWTHIDFDTPNDSET